MNNIITTLWAYFDSVMGKVAGIGFGVKEAIALTAVFVVIAGIRMLYLWGDFVSNDASIGRGLVMFAKAQFKNVVVWFLVAASPAIFAGLSSSVRGSTKWSSAPLATQGDATLNQALDAVRLLWNLRGTVEYFVVKESSWIDPKVSDLSAVGAADGTIAAQNLIVSNYRKARADADAALTDAQAMKASSNPAVKKAGVVAESIANTRIQTLDQARTTIQQQSQKVTAALTEESSRSLLEMAGRKVASSSFDPTGIGGIHETLMKVAAFLGSILVIGPALFLVLGAIMKIISAMVEVFTFIFGFVAMLTVVSSFSVGLAPLAMMSFVSDQWSKYGWSFVGFWLQAVVASVALGPLVSVASAGIGQVANLIGTTGIVISGAALGSSGVLDAALKCLIGALMFLGVGAFLGFFSTLLQKSLSGVVGLVNGSLHP